MKKMKAIIIVTIICLLINNQYTYASVINQKKSIDGTDVYYVSTQDENFLALSMIQSRMDTKAEIIYSGKILFHDTFLNDAIVLSCMPQNQVIGYQYSLGSLGGYTTMECIDAAHKTVTVYYKFNYLENQSQTQYVYNKIHQAIRENISSLKTDYQKALWAYQWVIDNVNYDFTETYYSAYDGLMNSGTVCQGYATLYCAIANELGLNCNFISGVVGESASRHAWNVIKLNGKWYCIDTTWGDYNGAENYFLKCKNTLSLPECGSHISQIYDSYISAGEVFADFDYVDDGQTETHGVLPSVYNIKMDILKYNILSVKEKYNFMISNPDMVSISFKSSDSGIAKVSPAGVITGVSKGIAIITAYNNDLNFEQSCEITVK